MSDSVQPHRWPPTRLVPGILQARTLEWVEVHFLLQCMKVKNESEVAQSCLTLIDPMDCSPPGSSVPGILPGNSTGVGCHFFLQGIFPTQGSNTGGPHCRQISHRLSHEENLFVPVPRHDIHICMPSPILTTHLE